MYFDEVNFKKESSLIEEFIILMADTNE